MSKRRSPIWVFAALLAFGCSNLIGADFDDAHPKPDDAGGDAGDSSGGSPPRGGSGGSGAREGGAAGEMTAGGAAAGGETNGGETSGGAPAGGASGAGAVGGSSSGAGGSAGDAGMSGDGGGGTGGTNPLNCKGNFGPPEYLFSGIELTSLSVTGDELELFYSIENPAMNIKVASQRREGAGFGYSGEVQSVKAACLANRPSFSVDVSDDGLRLYFTCAVNPDAGLLFVNPLHVTTRPGRARSDAFGPPDPEGYLPAGFSLSADERSAFAALGSPGETQWYERDGIFENARPVFEEGEDNLSDPDPSSDGLELYGILGTDYRLAVARRTTLDEDFGEPVFIQSLNSGYHDLSPSISADCRTLYFLRREKTASGPRTVTAYAIHRERCADGRDNDADLDVDCVDADCQTDVACP